MTQVTVIAMAFPIRENKPRAATFWILQLNQWLFLPMSSVSRSTFNL